MKQLLISISISISFFTFADYSMHKDSKAVIDELVNEYGFKESYVIEVLKDAKKRNEMLVSVAKPAEKTRTWDD